MFLPTIFVNWVIHVTLFATVGLVLEKCRQRLLNSNSNWVIYHPAVMEKIPAFFRIPPRYGTVKYGTDQEVFDVVFMNLAITGMTLFPLYAIQYLLLGNRMFSWDLPLPILYTITFLLAIEEVMFYSIHRYAHMNGFWYMVHSMHHRVEHPFSFTAFFAHPLEHLFLNILPVYVSALAIGLSWNWTAVWANVATINGLVAHSGLKMGWYHDKHHTSLTTNFGVLGIMDWAFGTTSR